jgi:glycosyltransferase involved in cell wall biosynthesis
MSRAASRAPATVLYVAWAPFFSGAERALLRLIDHLDRGRYEPVVAVGTHGQLEAELRTRGIRTVFAPVAPRSGRSIRPWLAGLVALATTMRRRRVQLLHANDVPSFQPSGDAARWLGVPSVVHIRFTDTAAGFRWFLRPPFARAIFVSASLCTTSSAAAPDVFDGRAVVVHDGVELPPSATRAQREDVRRELGLGSAPVVALIGQVAEVKGVWEFVDAADFLAVRGIPATFVIVGDDLKTHGALRRHVQSVVDDRKLSSRIKLLGFRADVARLMAAFDVIVAPSHVEPLGLTMLEGMACGLPVVGSNVGGIRETVVDGVTGLLVPPRNAAALADAIARVVGDTALAQRFGSAGRRRVADRFSIDEHVRRVQDVYEDVLGLRQEHAHAH